MRLRTTGTSTPVKIATYYLLWSVSAALVFMLFVDRYTIIDYASKIKPYSALSGRHFDREVLNSGGSGKVICFGDSSSFYPPDRFTFDGNPDIHTPGLIREAINAQAMQPGLRFSDWAFPGADMFDYYCLFYKAEKFTPDLIIVPVNWRSFGSDWINVPWWFYPELSALVPLGEVFPSPDEDPVRSRGISAVKQIEYKVRLFSVYPLGILNWAVESRRVLWTSVDRFLQLSTQAQYRIPQEFTQGAGAEDESPHKPGKDEEGPAAVQKSAAHPGAQDRYYPMRIADSNPTFRSLRALSYIASKGSTKVLFFICPVDRENLSARGIFESPAFEHSRRLIIETIGAEEGENVYFVDLSDLLEHEYFFDTIGHFTVEGRRKIAEALAPKVLEILQDDDGQRSSTDFLAAN